jgi:lysophospholipase L1-like esterase
VPLLLFGQPCGSAIIARTELPMHGRIDGQRGSGAVLAALIVAALMTGCAGSASATTAPAQLAVQSSHSRSTLSLVVVGDSIPFNSPDDCPGCTGFVERYASAAASALHRRVRVTNLSQHTGLTLPQLLDELSDFKKQLSEADIVVVGIAANSFELNAEKPCGAPVVNDEPDWPKLTAACSARSVRTYRPQFDRLYSTIRGWRHGHPTAFRTIDRYDDWSGWAAHPISTAAQAEVRLFLNDWDRMIQDSARSNGFVCVDLHAAFNGRDGRRASGALLADDYTHPSDSGNALIAKVLTRQGFPELSH